MTNTPDPIAHAARLLREAAQELKQAHTIGGIAEWDGTEPEVQAVYDEHMAAAAAIEEWERAVGAGGVEPLRKGAGAAQAAVIVTVTQETPLKQNVEFNWAPDALPPGEHRLYLAPQAQQDASAAQPSRECLQQSAELPDCRGRVMVDDGECEISWRGGMPPENGTNIYTEQQVRALLAATPAPAGVAVTTESVLIDGIAYEVPAAVAGELLGLHLDLLAAAPAQAAAWMTPEGDRVVTEATMAGARKDGGAMLSSLRPYTVALVRADARQDAPAAQPSRECLQQSASVRDPAVEKPEAGRYVLAWMDGKTTPIRAMWVPAKWLKADDECPEDWAEYDEAKDEYFCPEGWYEKNEHEEKNWSVSTPIVAWMELPRLAAAVAVPAEDMREKVTLALGLSSTPKGGPSFAWSYLLDSIRDLVKCEEELVLLKTGQEMSKARAALAAAPAQAVAVPVEVDLPDVEDMAHSAVQEALSYGVSHDVFHRWMRSVMDKTVQALAAAQAQEDARDAERFLAMASAAITEDAAFGECLERLGGNCKTIDDIRAVFDAARAAQGDRDASN